MFYSQNDHSLSLFDQTVRDTDEEFYATFPDAREALARSTNDQFSPLTAFSHHLHAYTHPDLNAVSPATPIPFALHTAGPSVSNVTGRVDQIRSRDTPSVPNLQGRKLRRTLRSPIPHGCELVMRLEDFSEPLSSRESSTQFSHLHTKQRRAHSLPHPPSRTLTWDSILSSSRSPIQLGPLPNKRHLEKKPPLACLFCRGRKIACGPPLPGSLDKTCNQCQRRSLRCEYPSESRRGMRKKKSSPVAEATAPDN